jgi:large subunit ribosomal protein L2
MAVKRYNPTSAGQRFITSIDTRDLTKKKPEKALVEVKKKHSGRNNNGHSTASSISNARKIRFRARSRRSNTIPTARPASRS